MISIDSFLYKIIHGECVEVMRSIPKNSIDMVLCDLPYGMTAATWDKHINMSNLWVEYKRILKKTGTIALFSCQPFTSKLISSNEEDFRYCWYWIKNQGTNFFHATRMPIRKIEEICIFCKGNYFPQITDGHIPTNSAKGCSNGKAYYGTNKRDYEGGKTTRYPTNILDFKCVSNYARLHSAEKPVDLCEYLIKTYTNENEIVLDNCIGSGSTCVAALKCNRKFIGIDKYEEWCDVSLKRIREEVITNPNLQSLELVH